MAGQPEFVGRTREFADLLGLWRAAKDGATRFALLSGPPGIGKSRLAAELALVARADGGATVRVKALNTERPVEWALVTEVIHDLYGMRGSSGTSAESDTILRRLAPSLNLRGNGHGSPHTGVSPSEAARVADALADLVDAVAGETPLLIIIDDLHWVDGLSRSVLAMVARRLRSSPCMVIVTCRGGVGDPALQRAVGALSGVEGAYHAELGPLSAPEIVEMLSFLGDCRTPAELGPLVRRIQQLAQGNPLFVIELVKLLRQDGVIEVGDGGWRIREDRLGRDLALPGNVRTMLERRFDGLSDHAGRVAARLAARGGAASADALRKGTGLGGGELAKAVDELLDREIIVPGRRNELAFVHDELRASAAKRFRNLLAEEERQRKFRHRTAWGAAAGVVVLLSAMILPDLLSDDPPPPPPYGGGTLFIRSGDSLLQAIHSHTAGSGWVAREADIWYPRQLANTYGPFLTTSGEHDWYRAKVTPKKHAFIVRPIPDGEERIIQPPEADTYPLDSSPTGRYILYKSENLATPEYDHDLYIAKADGSDPRRIYRTGGNRLTRGTWSPDGRLIAVAISTSTDTLAVMTPAGTRIFSLPFGTIHELAWCGNSRGLIVSARIDTRPRIVEVNWDSGSHYEVETVGRPLEYVTCSPDGTAVAYYTVLNGKVETVVQVLGTDSVSVLPSMTSGSKYFMRWHPDSLAPVVTGVTLARDSITLSWGGRRPLEAEVLYSDGSHRGEPVEWTSLEPGIASVGPGGVLFGNRSGTTRVVASKHDWHADTLHVTITGAPERRVLFQTDFETLDRDRWIMVGWPHPIAIVRGGEPVLSMRGDGLWTDGMIDAESFALPRGGTLELEFQLHLNRTAEQLIEACLLEMATPPAERPVDMADWRTRAAGLFPVSVARTGEVPCR